MKVTSNKINNQEETEKGYDVSRRNFLQLTGGLAVASALLSASPLKAGTTNQGMGKGDTALLNFLYVLQQIEASFYAEALAKQNNLNNTELAALMNVKNQEAAHTKVLKKMLGGNALPTVPTNFSAVSFSDRASVLKHAAIIEDMVISGLNGAAGLFNDSDHLLPLSKIAMAEAGHSAYFRNKVSPNSFGEGVINGRDNAGSPADVLAMAEAYTHVTFDKTNLPNHTNI